MLNNVSNYFGFSGGESVTRQGASFKRGKMQTAMRNYAAAETGDLLSSWTTAPMTSDQTIKKSLMVLVARSREQYENNEYARKFISMLKANVVGSEGFKFQSQIKDPNGNVDTVANNAVESAWTEFTRKENCDISRQQSLYEQCILFISSAAMDGEVIVRKIRGKDAGKWGFALQFIDPVLLDVKYNDNLKNGNIIRLGIEFDKYKRPVNYYFKTDSNGNHYAGGASYVVVPADEIIHSFIRERIDQKRGIPWMSTALVRMQMLDGYFEASLVNARVGASTVGVIETPTGEEYTGDDIGEDGGVIMTPEAGTFMQVAEGTQLHTFDPKYPTGEFPDFAKAMLRSIGAAFGTSYNGLANDLEGVSFSSIRSGVLEEREVWKMIQSWMIKEFLIPVYEEWIDGALIYPRIPVGNGYLRPENKSKYKQVNFQGRRWPWVDPLKDLQANILAIEKGLKSRSDVMAEQGRDSEEVWLQLKRENDRLKELGINVQQSEPAKAGFLSTDENEEDENGDEKTKKD